jgi:type I restriction enzyme, S subunit
MIADLKPYPEYKESGLPWLGQVPGHWDVKRAKSIFQRIDERSKTGREELLTVSSARGIVPRKTANVTMFKAESYLGYKLCWPGDLVINSLWAWAGGLGVSRHHGIISSAYGVYRIRQDAPMIPAFVHEVVRSSSFNWELRVRSRGVWISRLQLTDISFLDAPMHIPPPTEQAAIVRFLDWANGRLERAIRAKRKVIALLNEQKQAIIHRAVTRGLPSTGSGQATSVPLKLSGIPWLGEIPKHWEVWPLRRCISIRSGDFADPLHLRTERSEPHCIPVVGGNGVMGFTDRANNRDTTIVIGRVGALCGNVHLIDGDAWITDNALRITRITGFVARYLAEQLRVMDLNRLANANAQPLITGGMIKSQRVVKPPQDEQNQIADRLPALTAPTITTISRLEREIELLREYRTRLVADVVTGKLDVREAAARLPDEAAADIVEERDEPNLDDDNDAQLAEAED